jgi:hypothetical protein
MSMPALWIAVTDSSSSDRYMLRSAWVMLKAHGIFMRRCRMSLIGIAYDHCVAFCVFAYPQAIPVRVQFILAEEVRE